MLIQPLDPQYLPSVSTSRRIESKHKWYESRKSVGQCHVWWIQGRHTFQVILLIPLIFGRNDLLAIVRTNPTLKVKLTLNP